MAPNNTTAHHDSPFQRRHYNKHTKHIVGRRDLPARRNSPWHQRRPYLLLSPFFLISLILATIQLQTTLSASYEQMTVQIGQQQAVTIDLRQQVPISPYLYGVNVFPREGSNSADMPFSGFMKYTPYLTKTMQDMHMELLRYPGGDWGEYHVLSLNQLSDFSQLLIDTGSEGMLQAHLSGPVQDQPGNPQPSTLSTDLNTRARLAGSWVDYMNNPWSKQRTGVHAHDPYHPVKFWTVGNEPDLSIDPLTRQIYTITDYVNAFIRFSQSMHESDPTIKLFGPEISQFYGIGAGPFDATGNLWMDDFLKEIASYEQHHPALPYHILDGVSFHRYQFDNAQVAPDILLSSSNEWDRLLTPLRDLIKRDFGRDLPISLSEVNTNPSNLVPTRGLAALWWADTLGVLLNQQIEQVAFFSASGVEKPYPLFTHDGLHMTAMAWVMQLFSHLQHNLIPLRIQNEPARIYATSDDTAQTVSLLFINTSPIEQAAQIRPASLLTVLSPWHNQAIRLAPYSIMIVTMHRDSRAESYRFITTSGDTVTATPLTYTLCGTSNDIPANDKPC